MLKELLPENWYVSKKYSKTMLDCMITEKTAEIKQSIIHQ